MKPAAAVLLALAALGVQAQPVEPMPQFTLWATSYCRSWGDPLGYTWTQCEQPARVVERIIEKPVIVEKTIIREVQVPATLPPPAKPPRVRG
jgi:hypothetical protein